MITTGTLDFRDALPEGGALMALDLGTQTIGTAFCDAGWNFATPGKTLKRGKFGADKAMLQTLVQERSVRGIVIGLPLNMDGSEGPRSQSSRAYARNLVLIFYIVFKRFVYTKINYFFKLFTYAIWINIIVT